MPKTGQKTPYNMQERPYTNIDKAHRYQVSCHKLTFQKTVEPLLKAVHNLRRTNHPHPSLNIFEPALMKQLLIIANA